MNMSKEHLTKADEQAKANLEIEGMHATPEDDALFAYMIDHGLTGDKGAKFINDYRAGRITIPEKYFALVAAAE